MKQQSDNILATTMSTGFNKFCREERHESGRTTLGFSSLIVLMASATFLMILVWFELSSMLLNWYPSVGDIGWINSKNVGAWIVCAFLIPIVFAIVSRITGIAWIIIALPLFLVRSAVVFVMMSLLIYTCFLGDFTFKIVSNFLDWSSKNPEYSSFFQPDNWYAWVILLALAFSLLSGHKGIEVIAEIIEISNEAAREKERERLSAARIARREASKKDIPEKFDTSS